MCLTSKIKIFLLISFQGLAMILLYGFQEFLVAALITIKSYMVRTAILGLVFFVMVPLGMDPFSVKVKVFYL